MMELGNVYEVFHIGDRVEVNDICYVYYGRTGTIIDVDETDPFGEPIYTIALDEAWTLDDDGRSHEIEVNASALAKIPRKAKEEVITMGLRSCKTYLTQIGKFPNKDNGFDSVIYEMEKERKFAERGTDDMKKLDVKKIIFSGPKTIVLWSDGTKTIVSMSKNEAKFDPEAAFCAAYTKKMFGTNSKIKRIIKEKSNIKKWKEENEVPKDQLYKLGLKALGLCEDMDITENIKAIERAAKEAEKLQDEIVNAMYNALTGHPYKEDNDGND